jgi:serine acetyltransferase
VEVVIGGKPISARPKKRPIELARSVVGPGVTIGEGAVLGLGSVATKDLQPWMIHQGVPAVPVKARAMRSWPA